MKRSLSTLVLFSLLLCSHVRAEDPVDIPDPGLKAAIEDELWVTDPTPTDMLELLSLDGQARNISSLTGLGYAQNLQSANFRFNHIGDVSPLGGLVNLVSLSLNDNEISDVSPLGGLVNLYSLDLHDNAISDVSALGGLANLTFLALRENPLSDISPLSGLSNLADLSLLNTKVSDVSPLTGLTSLRYVDLRDCPLSDASYDVYIPQMRQNNPGIEIELDSHRGRMLTLTSTFGGSVIDPGEGEFLYPFDALVRMKAQADAGFVFLRWTGPFPITENPVEIFMERDYEFRAHFTSLRDTLYVDDDAPGDPGPCDPSVYDPHADGTSDHPIESIQDAIEVAGQETTIIVRPGVYRENLNLLGKKVHLTASDPLAPHGGPCAVIEGVGGGPVVMIGAGGGSKCSLTGFIITKGRGDIAGAIYCSGCHPTISNCLIVGNRCTDPNGAVLHFYESEAVITNCTIADNYAGPDGAGMLLDDSDVTVVDSIFWDNKPYEIRRRDESQPSIRYCDVRGWWPDLGVLRSDPLFARPGHWVDPMDSSIVLKPEDSRAVWIDGDYHLKSQAGRWDPSTKTWLRDDVTSPCIDTGDPESDIGHEASPHGNVVNMGAYGGTTEASLSR